MNVAFNGNDDFIKKLTRIILENLGNEQFGGAQLGREAGISRSSLNRKLKSVINKSSGRFIREVRLQKALEMLQQNENTASEIAYKTGFSSPTHFNYCFHEFFGFTPGEAKRRARLGYTSNEDDSASEKEDIGKVTGSMNHDPDKKVLQSRWIIGPFVGFIILTVLFILIYYHQKNAGSGKENEKSIAVLPFFNDSPDSVTIYFINGISEALTDRLTHIRDLKVTSRNSVEQYRYSKKRSTPGIARKLGVQYIVEGSGQKIGDKVLISVQLIEARSDKLILSQQFTRKYEDVFNLYSEIALAVAEKIKAVITPEEKESIKKPSTTNMVAMRMYIRGDEINGWKYADWRQKIEYMKQAESYYRKAIQFDSTYSDAWVQLGEICLDKGKPDSALILAGKALLFNKENAKAYLLRSRIYSKIRDAETMKESLDLALKFDPDNPWIIHLLGSLNYYRGEFSEAIEALLKTKKLLGNLDPGFTNTELYKLELNTLRLARSLFVLGFYEEGKDFLDRWLELSEDDFAGHNYNLLWGGLVNNRFEEMYRLGLKTPGNHLYFSYMAMDLMFMKKYPEALFYFQKKIDIDNKNGSDDLMIHHLLGFVYLNLGQKERADKYFESSLKYVHTTLSAHPEYSRAEPYFATTDRYWQHAYFILASIYAARGEKEKAIENLRLLRRNYHANDLQVVTLLKKFPMFDYIRNEPEFTEYLKEAESHYLEEHKNVEVLLRKEGILK
jgi:TolB-like protein/AraC-like DNA-binding protein